jgi:polysaccharide export outer membrane protein
VTVAVAQVGPVDVLVLGNVKLPGKYSLQPESRLTDAIAAAGGLGPTDGDLPNARLQSPGGTVKEVSLQGLLHEGNVSLNLPVENEMTVYVPSPLTLNVQIFGAVDHPGDVLLHQGDRVLAAIARAGTNPGLNPDLNRVVVRRTGPDGKSIVQTVNIYEIVKSEDVGKDIELQKGDVVYVPQASKHINGADLLGTILGIGRLLVP